MEITFKNNVPVSAFAATGVCTVAPRFAVDGGSPAVVSPLTAPLSLTHQATILPTVQNPSGVKRAYMGPETKPSTKLGDFRGVPPRGRPV